MNDFLAIGFDSFVSLNKVVLICAMDSERLRRELKRRSIDKGSEKFFDACSGKKVKSAIILDDGMLVVSALGADTLIKRKNELYNGGTF